MFITAFPDYACQPKKKKLFFRIDFFFVNPIFSGILFGS